MTLDDVAQELARRMECDVLPVKHPAGIVLQGKGYQLVVNQFFGGWQAYLKLPEKPPQPFFGEAIDALEMRLKAKLTGRDATF